MSQSRYARIGENRRALGNLKGRYFEKMYYFQTIDFMDSDIDVGYNHPEFPRRDKPALEGFYYPVLAVMKIVNKKIQVSEDNRYNCYLELHVK